MVPPPSLGPSEGGRLCLLMGELLRRFTCSSLLLMTSCPCQPAALSSLGPAASARFSFCFTTNCSPLSRSHTPAAEARPSRPLAMSVSRKTKRGKRKPKRQDNQVGYWSRVGGKLRSKDHERPAGIWTGRRIKQRVSVKSRLLPVLCSRKTMAFVLRKHTEVLRGKGA